jgi:hypothetical protein
MQLDLVQVVGFPTVLNLNKEGVVTLLSELKLDFIEVLEDFEHWTVTKACFEVAFNSEAIRAKAFESLKATFSLKKVKHTNMFSNRELGLTVVEAIYTSTVLQKFRMLLEVRKGANP